jgi:hypothetical protein
LPFEQRPEELLGGLSEFETVHLDEEVGVEAKECEQVCEKCRLLRSRRRWSRGRVDVPQP